MTSRTHKISVRLNDKELIILKRNVKKTGISQEAYFRHLISGYIPREAPPPDYFAFMNELRRVGVSLNQIAAKAHSLGFIDEPKYDKTCDEFDELILKIVKAVISPQSMK